MSEYEEIRREMYANSAPKPGWYALAVLLLLPAHVLALLAGRAFSNDWLFGGKPMLGIVSVLTLGAYAWWCVGLIRRGRRAAFEYRAAGNLLGVGLLTALCLLVWAIVQAGSRYSFG